MPLLREEAERMADILEAVLARLSWPQDADHIVNIRSTLETIRSSLFTTLVDVQNIEADAGLVKGDDRVATGQELHNYQLGLDQLKESNVDDVDVVNNTSLHPTALTSPAIHDCVVLGNHVAMEMQEPLGDSHNTQDELNETTFVTRGNGMESNECNCNVIINTQCEPDKPQSPGYNHSESDCKPPSLTLQPPSSKPDEPGYKPPASQNSSPDESGYKPPAGQRDMLFPMRDQKSLLEIKQTLQRRADSQDQEA